MLLTMMSAPKIAFAQFDGKPADKKVILYSVVDCCDTVGWPEAESAFAKELSTLSIEYRRVSGSAPGNVVEPRVLESYLDDPMIVAAVLFHRKPEIRRVGVYIAVFKRASSGPELERYTFDIADGRGADTVVTLKAVEAVHAAFFEKPRSAVSSKTTNTAASAPTDGSAKDLSGSGREAESSSSRERTPDEKPGRTLDDAEPTADERDDSSSTDLRSSTPETNRWGLSAAPTVLWSPGGMGPMFGVDFSAQGQFMRWLVLDLSVLVKAYSQDLGLEGEVQSAEVVFGFVLIRGTGLVNIVPRGRLHPMVGIYAGGAVTWADGANDRELGTSRRFGRVGALGGDVRLCFDVLPYFTFSLGVKVGALLPKVGIGATVPAEDIEEGPSQEKRIQYRFGQPLVEGVFGLIVKF